MIEIFGNYLSVTEDGVTRSIVPGSFVSGEWVAADLSGESQEVRDVAEALWTVPVVTAFRNDLAEALRIGKPPLVPDRVSARQFGLQLLAIGIKDQVDAWVALQDAETQWAYERSATFVRADPMMQDGFAALGFTAEQIDDFFVAAAAL